MRQKQRQRQRQKNKTKGMKGNETIIQYNLQTLQGIFSVERKRIK